MTESLDGGTGPSRPRSEPAPVAYLVNQYPYITHTFIRREILALEALGQRVERFSIRPRRGPPGDAVDQEEARRTRVVLGVGPSGLLWALVRCAAGRPRRFAAALRLAIAIGWSSERGLLRHLAYLAEACVLVPWLARAGVDHVHAHFGTNPTAVAMLAHALGGPAYSFTAHGSEEFDKAPLIALSEKIRRARFVVGVSHYGRSQIFRHCPATDWSKIHVVRCGVDRSFLDFPERPVQSAPRLVCVGRLHEQKGQTILLEAAALLAREGVPFELVLVGDGELRGTLEALIARHGLGAHVRLAGWGDEDAVRREILAARALVHPSFAEGLPLVIVEALALSCPVIGTYVAGVPELVETGACGWLVPASSTEHLAGAMRLALAAAPEELARLGREGARRVRERHDARINVQTLLGLFSGATPDAS